MTETLKSEFGTRFKKEAKCVSFIDQDFDSSIEKKIIVQWKKFATGDRHFKLGRLCKKKTEKPRIGEKHDFENQAESTLFFIPLIHWTIKVLLQGSKRFFSNLFFSTKMLIFHENFKSEKKPVVTE